MDKTSSEEDREHHKVFDLRSLGERFIFSAKPVKSSGLAIQRERLSLSIASQLSSTRFEPKIR